MTSQSLDREGSDLENYVWEKSSSKFNYFAGYASNGAIVSWLYYCGAPLLTWGQLIFWSGVGLFLWTFLEYWLHRIAYHKGKNAFVVGHELHHEKPKALLGVPYYVTAAIYIPLSWALAHLFSPGPTYVLMGSCWFGYICYCVVHHSSHHWLLKDPIMKSLRSHHLQHHYHWDKNFGMVTSLWDRVFGTRV